MLFSASSSLYSLSRRSFRNNISFVMYNFLTRRLAKARFAPNFSLFLSRKISIDSPSRNFSSGQVFLFTSFYLFIHLIRLRFNTSWHKYYSVHRLINEKYRTVRRYRYHLSVFPARIFFESSNKSIVFHRGRFFHKKYYYYYYYPYYLHIIIIFYLRKEKRRRRRKKGKIKMKLTQFRPRFERE